ncbi:hypothetical protein [Cryobacterium fucosi]|uniref:Clp R domain-containing protein n=1 Tax=Cryobacterium fucosi TaxID=1259157 RepID=A0A4R9B7K7_9MICO|nr:hypothetical protein [Cryobacterium fucosi]TFD76276.1 hypothetical protein E3T48_10540 [Cryobacterium fucosi]
MDFRNKIRDIRFMKALLTAAEAETRELGEDLQRGRTPKGPFQTSGSAQLVFQRALALSKLDRPRMLRSAHVVHAVAELEQGTSSRVLGRLGIDRTRLQAAAREAARTPGR